jgi:hypothetical protein
LFGVNSNPKEEDRTKHPNLQKAAKIPVDEDDQSEKCKRSALIYNDAAPMSIAL